MKLTSLLFLFCGTLLGSLCDEQPHTNNGITVSCKLIPGETDTTLEVQIAGSSDATALTLVIGNPTFRRQIPLLTYPPSNGKRTYVVSLPANTDVQYIIIDEHQRSNSAGFGQ